MDDLEQLSQVVTGRRDSFFQKDLQVHAYEIKQVVGGARILVIGGGGTIGSAAVRELCQYTPSALHVVDLSENSLVELVRDLRSSRAISASMDFRALPVDFGNGLMRRYLVEQAPYDLILNFAAIKHVRSEKDVVSILHMFDTNIIKKARFLGWAGESGNSLNYFAVSSDKAANPRSLMGASKRLMEHLMFSQLCYKKAPKKVTTARFANVAFSDGSLLYGWMYRLARRQPLAVPASAKRYFVSRVEAAQICLLAATIGADQEILVPSMVPAEHLRELVEVAEAFLSLHRFKMSVFYSQDEAIANMHSEMSMGRYPVILTPLDTDGEKPYEEFLGNGECAVPTRMEMLNAIRYDVATDLGVPDRLQAFLNFVQSAIEDHSMPVTKSGIVRMIQVTIPEFRHCGTGHNLDERA